MQLNCLEKIDIKHKSAIESIRLKYGVDTNAMSFYSCYIWQNYFKHKLYLIEDMYAVTYNLCGENAWYFPVGEPSKKIEFINNLINENQISFHKLNDNDKCFLEANFPGKFIFIECQDDSEYIYDTKEICDRKGRKFSELRFKYNHPTKMYDVRVEPISESVLPSVFEIIKSWGEGKAVNGEAKTIGNETDINVLRKHKELDLRGIVIWIDGRLVSVSAGYPLSSTMFDFSICKTVSDIKYLGYVTTVEAIKNIANDYQYVNLEEDLGISGLRTMKNIMGPCRKLRLWKADLV